MSVTSTKSIEGITFAVWSPQEIRKYSVVEITQPETYDEDGMAVQGGLICLLYTSPSPRDLSTSRMPSSA